MMRVLHLWGSGGAGIWVLMHFWQSLLAPLVSSTISWQFFESICENDNLDLNCSWFFLSFPSETELQLGRKSYQPTTKALGCSWLVWLLSLLAALSGLPAMGLGAAQALTAPGWMSIGLWCCVPSVAGCQPWVLFMLWVHIVSPQ